MAPQEGQSSFSAFPTKLQFATIKDLDGVAPEVMMRFSYLIKRVDEGFSRFFFLSVTNPETID